MDVKKFPTLDLTNCFIWFSEQSGGEKNNSDFGKTSIKFTSYWEPISCNPIITIFTGLIHYK
jgi:hypothetical protein